MHAGGAPSTPPPSIPHNHLRIHRRPTSTGRPRSCCASATTWTTSWRRPRGSPLTRCAPAAGGLCAVRQVQGSSKAGRRPLPVGASPVAAGLRTVRQMRTPTWPTLTGVAATPSARRVCREGMQSWTRATTSPLRRYHVHFDSGSHHATTKLQLTSLSLHAGFRQVARDFSRNKYFDTNEAQEYGLIDQARCWQMGRCVCSVCLCGGGDQAGWGTGLCVWGRLGGGALGGRWGCRNKGSSTRQAITSS